MTTAAFQLICLSIAAFTALGAMYCALRVFVRPSNSEDESK